MRIILLIIGSNVRNVRLGELSTKTIKNILISYVRISTRSVSQGRLFRKVPSLLIDLISIYNQYINTIISINKRISEIKNYSSSIKSISIVTVHLPMLVQQV